MAINQYLELSSAYRDRSAYPNPAQFIVRQYLAGNRQTAYDAVHEATVLYPYDVENGTHAQFGYMIQSTSGSTLVDLIPSPANRDTDVTRLPLVGADNALAGDTLELVDHTVGGAVTASNEYRAIVASETTIKSYATGVDGVQPITSTSVPLLASFACDIDDFFVGWDITFATTTDTTLSGTTRRITRYRGYDRRVFFDEPIASTVTAGDTLTLSTDAVRVLIDEPFSVAVSSDCALTDNTTYRVRDGGPFPIDAGTLVAGTTTTFTLPASIGSVDVTGMVLQVTTDPVVFSGALTSASFVSDGTTQVAGTFVLPAGASQFADDFLNNMTITLTSGAFDGYSFLITDWDNGTLTGTVTPGWTSLIVGTTNPSAADTFIITQPTANQYRTITEYDTTTRVGTVSAPFTYTNVGGTTTAYAVGASDTYAVLNFDRDNARALNYAKSVTLTQQPSCWEIRLVSLTLPNVPLETGHGGVIADYPFVYVVFRGVSDGSSGYNRISSNNPIVSNASVLFKAPVIYNYTSDRPFIVLDGHGMCQVTTFTPQTAYQFAVYLPNGELFRTRADTTSPTPPDPLLQITACFSIRRCGSPRCDETIY